MPTLPSASSRVRPGWSFVFFGDLVEERGGVDFVQRFGVRCEFAVFVALDQERLHPLVFAVGGEVGADVERLAAAGRDRHDAVEDDDVADRPGQDRQDEGDEEDGGAGEAETPSAPRQVADRREDDEGGADQQVLRPEHRRQAEEQPRHEPRPDQRSRPRIPGTTASVARSEAQRKARIAAGRVSIAGGSLISSPVVWRNGRVDRDREGGEEADPAAELATAEPPAQGEDDEDRRHPQQRLDDPRRPFPRAAGRVEGGGVEERGPRRPVARVVEFRPAEAPFRRRAPWRSRSRRASRQPGWRPG